jgi:hypothetical protein
MSAEARQLIALGPRCPVFELLASEIVGFAMGKGFEVDIKDAFYAKFVHRLARVCLQAAHDSRKRESGASI